LPWKLSRAVGFETTDCEGEIEMTNPSTLLPRLVERRSSSGRWVYVICAIVVTGLALFAAAMGGIGGTVIYVPILLICIAQFLRPTLLGWLLLVALFSAYAIGVATHLKHLTRLDLVVFLSIGFVPVIGLLWSRPKPIARA
jgi:hypothetical protein